MTKKNSRSRSLLRLTRVANQFKASGRIGKKAAIHSCIKCGYGFAGRKPDGFGSMIDLTSSDPDYIPTKPCPSCKFVLNPSSSQEEEVNKVKAKEGFGEKYYVIYQPMDGDVETIGGPIYGKSEAEDHRELLINKIKNSIYFKDVDLGELGKLPEVLDEEEVVVVSESSDSQLAKEIEDGLFDGLVMRPSQQIKKVEEWDKSWRAVKLRELKERPPTKDENVAKSLKKIKFAQFSSNAKLAEYCSDLFFILYGKYTDEGYTHTDAVDKATAEVDEYYSQHCNKEPKDFNIASRNYSTIRRFSMREKLLVKKAQSVLGSSDVQMWLDNLKELLVQTGTATRRPGLGYRERYSGGKDIELSSPSYRVIPVYDYDPSRLKDPKYKAEVDEAWEVAKEEVIKALQNSKDAPKNWRRYYNDMDAPNPGEWLYNVDSFIESSYEKTSEGQSYARLQDARARARIWIIQKGIRNNEHREAMLALVNQLQTDGLKTWLKYCRSYKTNASGTKVSRDIKDLIDYGNQLLQQQRTVAAQAKDFRKIAKTLVATANKFDVTNPSLAKEADKLLADLYKLAQNLDPNATKNFMKGYGGIKMMGCSDKCSGSYHDHPTDSDVMYVDDLDMHNDHDPEIVEIEEPTPEYDLIGLDDVKSELENMKWRIADKKRREALETAIEHIEKAQQYHDACKSRKDKVHSIFDNAGLALRLKDFT